MLLNDILQFEELSKDYKDVSKFAECLLNW